MRKFDIPNDTTKGISIDVFFGLSSVVYSADLCRI